MWHVCHPLLLRFSRRKEPYASIRDPRSTDSKEGGGGETFFYSCDVNLSMVKGPFLLYVHAVVWSDNGDSSAVGTVHKHVQEYLSK